MTQLDERHPAYSRILFPCIIGIFFFGIVLVQAHVKLLWGDEFITFWIGQQKSFHGIWNALAGGADPNPPLMHVMSWFATSAFGTGPIAIRLPSILTMALALVCLWRFLRRRFAPVYAAAGCLALMATRGFDYAYDARSYSLLMGFAMAALLFWAMSVEAHGVRRLLLLAATAIALAAGLSSNYYGVISFVPVVCGELAFAISQRRWRPGAWIAMAMASAPLFWYLKLIRMNVAEFGPHAWNKPEAAMVPASYLFVVEGILFPIVGLALYAWLRSQRQRVPVTPTLIPVWERVAVRAVIAYPVIAFLMAVCDHAMVSPRCALPVCLGVVIAATALLARVATPRRAAYVVVLLCFWVLARQAICGYFFVRQHHAFLRLVHGVERAAAPGEPVVVGDSLLVMPLYWYSSPALKQQIVFPIDFEAIHRMQAEDSGEQNLWGGRHGVFPVPIDKPVALFAEVRERILIAPPNGWVARTADNPGIRVIELPAYSTWDRLGGVLMSMVHGETRVMIWPPK